MLRHGLLSQLVIACLASTAAAVVVDCDVDEHSSSAAPQGLHTAFAADPSTSIAVSFFTCGGSGTPLVTLLDQPRRQISGTSTTLFRKHHNVLILGLQPSTAYSFIVQLNRSTITSAPMSFRTASADRNAPFVAAILGDMGVNGSDATVAALRKRSLALNTTIHVGDVSYADDTKLPFPYKHLEPSSGRGYEAVYDLFQTTIEDIAVAAPYMVGPGNHDVSCHVTGDHGCPWQQRNFSAFNTRWRMPAIESGAAPATSPHNMWFSWDLGSVHFISISTESDFKDAPTTPDTFFGGGKGGGFGDQLAWLERDLKHANADSDVKWIIMMGHRPWLATKSIDWPLAAPRHVERAFEPLMRKYGVDLYICAHKHYYERFSASFEGKEDLDNGTVQIVNGAAGNNENLDQGKGVDEAKLLQSANYRDHGYGELQVSGSTMRWQYILSSDGSVFDEVLFPSKRTN